MNYTNLLWIMFALVVMEGKTLHQILYPAVGNVIRTKEVLIGSRG